MPLLLLWEKMDSLWRSQRFKAGGGDAVFLLEGPPMDAQCLQ